MENNLFNSSFAKNSKFDKNFVGNIKNINEWLILVNQYKVFKIKILLNPKFLYSKNSSNMVRRKRYSKKMFKMDGKLAKI